MCATEKAREKSHDNIWQSPKSPQCAWSVGWISVDFDVKFLCFFFLLFLAYKNVKIFVFVVLHKFYRFTVCKTRLEVQISVVKRDAWNWALNKIPRTIKNSKEEFFQCSDVAAVYCTPVSFTGHRSNSRVWRIHETLVIGTATRKKSNRDRHYSACTTQAEFKTESLGGCEDARVYWRLWQTIAFRIQVGNILWGYLDWVVLKIMPDLITAPSMFNVFQS